MAKKIMLCNEKGGVGKTTSSVNISACLAKMGFKVLGMDFDKQSHMTKSFGIKYDRLEKSLVEVFLGKCVLQDAIIPFSENLHVLPARPDLIEVAQMPEVANHARKNEIIKFKLYEIEADYDYIIMDTPPSATHLLVQNCFAMADYVIVPLELAAFSIDGLKQFINIVAGVREQFLNPGIKIMGLLITFYETNPPKDMQFHMDKLMEGTQGRIAVFGSKIRKNTDLRKAATNGKPITLFNKHCHGYADYMSLTEEILQYAPAAV